MLSFGWHTDTYRAVVTDGGAFELCLPSLGFLITKLTLRRALLGQRCRTIRTWGRVSHRAGPTRRRGAVDWPACWTAQAGRCVHDTPTPSYPDPNHLRRSGLRPSSPTRRSAPRVASMGASRRCSLGLGSGLLLLRLLFRVRVRGSALEAAR